mmetsp:Transcript_11699/g.43591  ORF Transcript_11699/g.43591 Transcript_11699/m.43591 type:complete len:277 (-) Transcript_11699:69-899(-)|eukprot:scaffold748_cov251-Pinguiococcus_pyrenoidosus.AAC.1
MSVDALTADAAVARAANYAGRRSKEVEALLEYCQCHLDTFTDNAKDFAELSITLPESDVNGLLDCVAEMEELGKLVDANNALTNSISAEEVAQSCTSLLDVAHNGSEESSTALMALLRDKHVQITNDRNGAHPAKEPLEELRQKIKQTFQDEEEGKSDDELEEEGFMTLDSGEMSLKCPLTLMDFTDPVTNSACGHTYNKDAILAYLKRVKPGQSRPCPVAGCVHVVSHATLKVNKRIQYAVDRKKRLDAASRKRSDSLDLKDDEDDEEEEDELIL